MPPFSSAMSGLSGERLTMQRHVIEFGQCAAGRLSDFGASDRKIARCKVIPAGHPDPEEVGPPRAQARRVEYTDH
jgi:hypothetical protein